MQSGRRIPSVWSSHLGAPPLSLLLSLLLWPVLGCDLTYPEIVVVNKTAEPIQLRNFGFSGCAWDAVLRYGEATSPRRCLPGEDRVHFEKLDAAAYCRDQSARDAGADAASGDAVPTWFNYQTRTAHRVDYGEFHVFEITLDDMEQDFSVPGPYGH